MESARGLKKLSNAGGPERIRTAVDGFAIRWIASLPPGPALQREISEKLYRRGALDGQHFRSAFGVKCCRDPWIPIVNATITGANLSVRKLNRHGVEIN